MLNDCVPAPASFESAEAAFKRVEPAALALTEAQFSPLNVDLLSATSTMLGVAPRILSYRDKIQKNLVDFDMSNIDTLVEKAHAAWFAYVTNLPEAEPMDFQELLAECTKMRATLLSWAIPLVHTKQLADVTIKHIKEGSGHKEIPSDLLALVSLFRSKWSVIQGQCGVTEEQLERGEKIAPMLFASIGRRDNPASLPVPDSALRTRRFWTLADRAYHECRRAILYLERDNAHIAESIPSLRRNAGRRGASSDGHAATRAAEPPTAPAALQPMVADDAPQFGEGGSPFTNLSANAHDHAFERRCASHQ